MSFFKVTHQDKNSQARTGIIKTNHGNITTPTFMPVGTQANVKTLDQQDLAARVPHKIIFDLGIVFSMVELLLELRINTYKF